LPFLTCSNYYQNIAVLFAAGKPGAGSAGRWIMNFGFSALSMKQLAR
jgi:hypothetical protein